MRRSKGALLPAVAVTRIHRGDLYQTLRKPILDGTFRAGERFPSSRQAASDYGVSRGMVEEVFMQLVDEGFLERAVGQGTFVATQVAKLGPSQTKKGRGHTPRLSRRGLAISAKAACREPEIPVPFNAGIADASEFPWEKWRLLEQRASRRAEWESKPFADPRGLAKLRESLAHYLAQFRGIHCTAEQIVIFNSAQQALNALCILLLDRTDAVWNEDPCYLGARAAFELANATVVPVPVDEEGIHVKEGMKRCRRARLAYVTPSHQYPTGAVLSLERRIELLDWARRNDSWIVEDDYDGEFGYEGQQLTPLYTLDPQSRVLYVGTLNKSMFISLRLAYAVVPERVVEPLANIRTQMDGFTSPVKQMAMSSFLDEGFFSTHLRHMRLVYRAKCAALVAGLAPLIARGWTCPSRPSGMHLLVRHKQKNLVRTVAAASSLDLALLSSYRTQRASDDGLFLRYGALDAQSLQTGVKSLVATVDKIMR